MTKRREFLMSALTLTGAVGAGALASDAIGDRKRRIVALNTSHRPDGTCAAALRIVLDSVKEADASFETELIELATIEFEQALVGRDQPDDALTPVLAKIAAPDCAGIVIASPVYFGLPSGRCVSLISRLMPIKKAWGLKNKIFGAVAVGAARNGGQETILHTLANSMLTQQMILAVDAAPTSHWGATLWSQNGSIEADEFGRNTAKNLGSRIVELAGFVR